MKDKNILQYMEPEAILAFFLGLGWLWHLIAFRNSEFGVISFLMLN